MGDTRIIKRGEIILLTSGEHSDYDVKALVKAKADIDIDFMRREYLNQFPNEGQDYSFEVFHFINWLKGRGVARELKYREFHLGGYGFPDFSLDVDRGLE